MENINTLNEYDFEIYTKNPETGETGWDIKFVRVYAKTRNEAGETLKTFPDFDCVITRANGGMVRDNGLQGTYRELNHREYGG
jgi:hypothetical protein